MIGVTKQNQIELNPDQQKKLYKRHFQGALVRSGASLFMWLFALSCIFSGLYSGKTFDWHQLIGWISDLH